MEIDQLKYPIGPFKKPDSETFGRAASVQFLREFPGYLNELVSQIPDETMDRRYRPEGWTLRQLIHHIADSHMNAYIRFKWTLTEDSPKIKTYYEDRWAELADSSLGVQVSLNLINAIHVRWTTIMDALTDEDWEKVFYHPEAGRNKTLLENLALYVWHSKHHYAHIESALKKSY